MKRLVVRRVVFGSMVFISTTICAVNLNIKVISTDVKYPIVDTGQSLSYDNKEAISSPKPGSAFDGQDAQYSGSEASYKDNGDGTITDNVTDLMWIQDPGSKKTFSQAVAGASKCKVGGYTDWRLPTIKELYSLINFNGIDPDPRAENSERLIPFIDNSIFNFSYGKPEEGDRIIDSQFASSTKYVNTTMHGDETVFGVNFADGRIKGYGLKNPRGVAKTFYVLYVRGNSGYGKNIFKDNGNGTVTDEATGLTWTQRDSGKGMDWETALKYVEATTYAGHSDWRLPNAKELQSIVDYTRSPDTTDSAAISELFQCTSIQNEAVQKDYAHYWTSTTHKSQRDSSRAVYIAFGRSLGYMTDRRTGKGSWLDVHGAGAQRSDLKSGNGSELYPQGHGPQGDAQRGNNMVRLVRGGDVERSTATTMFIPQSSTLTKQKKQDPKNVQDEESKEKQRQANFIEKHDKSKDGRVSVYEFEGSKRLFDNLDKNNDQYISLEEAPSEPRKKKNKFTVEKIQ